MFPTHYRILVASVLSGFRHFFRQSSSPSPRLRVFPEQNSRWINYYLNQAPLWYYVILFFGDSGPLVIVLAQWTVRINRSSWLLCWAIASGPSHRTASVSRRGAAVSWSPLHNKPTGSEGARPLLWSEKHSSTRSPQQYIDFNKSKGFIVRRNWNLAIRN